MKVLLSIALLFIFYMLGYALAIVGDLVQDFLQISGTSFNILTETSILGWRQRYFNCFKMIIASATFIHELS